MGRLIHFIGDDDEIEVWRDEESIRIAFPIDDREVTVELNAEQAAKLRDALTEILAEKE